jgi:hypothetical protein
MESRTWTIPLLALCVAAGTLPAAAQDVPESGGFSQTRLLSVRAAKPAANGSKTCLRYEASFSSPLQEKPKAILDLERLNLIQGVISFILNVTPVGDHRYSLAMETDDPARCEEIRKSHEKIQITVDGAVGADGHVILPDQATFRNR